MKNIKTDNYIDTGLGLMPERGKYYRLQVNGRTKDLTTIVYTPKKDLVSLLPPDTIITGGEIGFVVFTTSLSKKTRNDLAAGKGTPCPWDKDMRVLSYREDEQDTEADPSGESIASILQKIRQTCNASTGESISTIIELSEKGLSLLSENSPKTGASITCA